MPKEISSAAKKYWLGKTELRYWSDYAPLFERVCGANDQSSGLSSFSPFEIVVREVIKGLACRNPVC